MNIEIGNTTQTFELENEVIWHLKEKKNQIWNNSAAFYANYNSFKNVFWMFRISRLHQIFEIHASDLSWYIVDRTLRTNPLTIISFIEEFSDILEPIIFSHDPLFLTDDFDIRVDNHNDTAAYHFFDLLEWILLTRRVSESTHELGHVLDLIITRNSDNFIGG